VIAVRPGTPHSQGFAGLISRNGAHISSPAGGPASGATLIEPHANPVGLRARTNASRLSQQDESGD
jgi:hypothetical protein